jgi:hypothetical protein
LQYLANWASKFEKVIIRPQNLSFTKFEYGNHTNLEFYADFEKDEKNAKNSPTKKLLQNKCAKF